MSTSILKYLPISTVVGVDYIGYREWQWSFLNQNKTEIDLKPNGTSTVPTTTRDSEYAF